MDDGRTGGGHCHWRGRVKKEGERLKVPLEMPDDAGLQAARGEQKKPGKSGVDLCGRADVDARTWTRTAGGTAEAILPFCSSQRECFSSESCHRGIPPTFLPGHVLA